MSTRNCAALLTSVPAFLTGGGEMGALMRAHDWSGSPLGAPESWPQPLKTLVGVMLGASQPMFIAWGEPRTLLYNDAYAEILGDKHPHALGHDFLEVWHEIRGDLIPVVEQAYAGEPVHMDDIELVMCRRGYPEETHFSFSYTPVRDESGSVVGFFCPCNETTGQVLTERAQAFRLTLEERLRSASEPRAAMDAAVEALGRYLGAVRVGYSEVRADGETIDCLTCYADGVEPILGTFHLADFGRESVDRQRGGATKVIADVQADPAQVQKTWAAIDTRAFVSVPLVREGRLRASLYVNLRQPHAWTVDEVALIEEVAVRTWAAVERTRAEERLRASEARYRMLFEAIDAGFCVVEVDLDTPAGRIDYRVVEANPAFYRQTGFPEAILGRWLREAAPDLEEHWYEIYGRVARRGEPERFEQGSDMLGRWFDVYAFRIGEPHERRVAILFNDISKRKAAEEALAESEARLRALTDNLPSGMVYQIAVGADRAERRFLHVSQSHEKLTGVAAEAVLADSSIPYNLILPEDRDRLSAAEMDAIHNRRSLDVEVRFRRTSGDLRWCRIISAPREQADGSTIWDGIQIDTTDQKQAEERLAIERAMLATLVEHLPVGVIIVDRAGTPLYCNPAYRRIVPEATLPSRLPDASKRWIGQDASGRRIVPDQFVGARALRGETVRDTEFLHRAPGGRETWTQVSGVPLRNEANEITGAMCVVVDIDARKRIEETLEERVAARTAQRDRVWKNSRDLLVVIDRRWRITAANPAASTLLGYAVDETIGRKFSDYVHPEDLRSVARSIRAAATSSVGDFEARLRARDGSWRWFSWSAAPGEGEAYVIGRDVSAEKARQAELKAVQEALRQSQKLESLGQLTGGVAHDINNMLAPITGALDLLQRKGLGGEREQRLIDGALLSAERTKVLVQRLLAFARRQPLQTTAVDLPMLIDGMAGLVASTTGPQIKVVVDVTPDLPLAQADANQLEMALLNLAVNGRDAMPDGGTLRISAEIESVGKNHRSKLSAARYVRLSVADTGIGMDEATLARAIEPFFSTKGIGKGTGLGLSMVHGLAAQLGGALAISSRPGLGTNVELWLPVAELTLAAQSQKPDDAPPPAASGTVLLVDDEDLVRMSTADMLADLGYAVVEAESAEEALRLINGGLSPDLLVTDHLMPGLSGAELAREVRQCRPDMRVLLVSGYAEVEGIAPADLPRLAKPFRRVDLATKLASLSMAGG